MKAIEHQWIESEQSVGDIGDIVCFENQDILFQNRYIEYNSDKMNMRNLLFFLTVDEVTILLFKNLGYATPEIISLMGLKNVMEYYGHLNSLKKRVYLFNKLTND